MHDNGNMITFPDRHVYVRADRELYAPDGSIVPGVGAIIAALLTV